MPTKMPSEVVCGLVSLWLIFHFFCIGLALALNPAIDPSTSQLVAKLMSTFSVYLYPLWLGVPQHDAWSNGEPSDADHVLVAQWTDSTGEHKLEFPTAGSTGENRERLTVLARQAASPIYFESPNRDLLAKIGEGILKRLDAQEVRFRVRRHNPLTWQDAAADDPGQRDPNNARTYTELDAGTVTLNSNGEGDVHIPQQALDVAPVTNASQRGSSSGQERSGARSKGSPTGQEMPPLPPADGSKKPATLDLLKGLSQPENRDR
jgi:hypothetical protein